MKYHNPQETGINQQLKQRSESLGGRPLADAPGPIKEHDMKDRTNPEAGQNITQHGNQHGREKQSIQGQGSGENVPGQSQDPAGEMDQGRLGEDQAGDRGNAQGQAQYRQQDDRVRQQEQSRPAGQSNEIEGGDTGQPS